MACIKSGVCLTEWGKRALNFKQLCHNIAETRLPVGLGKRKAGSGCAAAGVSGEAGPGRMPRLQEPQLVLSGGEKAAVGNLCAQSAVSLKEFLRTLAEHAVHPLAWCAFFDTLKAHA